MPKSRPLATSVTYSCDICDFKVTNSYIFKRHLHRCYTLHGVASKRSSPRIPLRMKGTEGVKSKASSEIGSASEEVGDVQSVNSSCQEGDSLVDDNDHVDNDESQVIEGVSQGEDNSPSPVSSQWSVKDSPQTVACSIQQDGVAVDEASDFIEKVVSLDGGNENTAFVDGDRSLTDSPSSVVRAKFERNYACEYCDLKTLKSREFLYHIRDVHGERLNIFECPLCDYASRYNNKLARHMAIHNKANGGLEDESDKKDLLFDDSYENQELKVKPLKLKRLHVKAPSVFQVTHESKVKRESQASPPMGKDVFKMVLLADGTHDYQCRDCLFYASSAMSVKKHHNLCHNKLLQCGKCDFNTTSQAEYYEHIITHENSGKAYLKCPDCSYVTNARPNFENHRSHHGSDLPFKCRVCNFAADSESKVKRHMASQHTNRSNDSVVEKREPQQVDAADKSNWMEESGNKFVCEDDMGNFDANIDDESSIYHMEAMELSRSKPKKPPLKFKCPHCLVVCLRRANLTRHLVARHDFTQKKASIFSKTLERQLLRKKKPASTLLSSSSMPSAKHFSRPPSATGQENLKCSECSYYAKWPSDLRRHKQVHTIVKRFKCPICTNKYKYLGDLNVHMRRDHLMEPQQHTVAEDVVSSEVVKKSSPVVFRCPICAFATSTKADLEQHTRQHGDIEKTFQCRLCDYQTYWRGDVGRHLFRHHSIHLNKDTDDLEKHFIFRPNIRPLTKMPMSHYLSMSTPSESLKVENDSADAFDSIPLTTTPNNSRHPSSKLNFKRVLMSLNSSGKEGTLVCSYPSCDYKTSLEEKLNSHMAIHDNIKQYMCPTCGKRTNYKWDIVKHMVKVHKNPQAGTEDVITLSIQEARETIAEYLRKSEKKPPESIIYICSSCDFQSGERSLVTRHLGEQHANGDGHVLSIPSTSSQITKLESDLVKGESSFPLEDRKDNIMLKFVEPSPEELAKYDKPYACSVCKKTSMTMADVKKHYNYAHPYKEVIVIYTVDGTEFNYNTLDIYPQKVVGHDILESGESISPSSSSHQTSPFSSKKAMRSESKYSNPKMHGYVKPFKCSVCGLRSNWKWDLKKHLRSKHPHDGGFVIMLSIEEAQMTYGKECSRSHPKCEGQFITPHPTLSPDINKQVIRTSPTFSDLPLSPSNPVVTSGKSKVVPASGTRYDPNRRQWKCSGCDYITNWRRNMARHMARHHGEAKVRLRAIALHLLSKQEQEIILEERRARLEKLGKRMGLEEEEEASDCGRNGNRKDLPGGQHSWLSMARPFSKLSFGTDGGRLWKCPKCSYHSTLKTHIIVHMQKHEMRPFICAICNAPFMNRGPLHRHLQKVHERADYIKLVKVNIRYDGVIDHLHRGMQQFFHCVLCEVKFSDKSSAVEHLNSIHGVEAKDYIKVVNSTPVNNNNSTTSSASNEKLSQVGSSGSDVRIRSRKIHHCRLCPYQSQKKSMLTFHMTYHKPTPTNRFKCKHCPYYVSTTRLLHQHQRKWHADGKRIDNNNALNTALWEHQLQAQITPTHSPYKSGKDVEDTSPKSVMGTPRKHACEKCPYTTNSKNDFFYHKQFHRPKRSAEYKCDVCDYWVVHKRLLKQHMRLHEQAGLQEVSPAKSVYSDPGLVYDPIELTELAALKQKMILSKVLPSLSRSPKISPMKIASRCSVDDRPGYVLKNGLYRKLHKCPKCPYTNTRVRNMNLHVMMHGPRESSYPLMRCPYCDYYVGSKGLLSHHMKVHQKTYGDTPEKDAKMAAMGIRDDDEGDDSDDVTDIQAEQKVDTLLQISRMKRFGCEKCPYASAKRQHFERHLELHGSRQRYTCQYCDYSVPSSYLLTQHSRLHLMPNQNLLSCQSINNLMHVSEVPADVALASALPPSDCDMSVTISVIHDHLGLYENSIYDPEERKLYRCDRCPYANVRRDHLLSHLKFHMVASSQVCPYCDYSAPKQSLLTQHISVHFCPLPELSDWLLENGQTERETSQRNIDMAEALKVAQEYQSQSKKKLKGKEGEGDGGCNGGEDKGNAEEKENIEERNGPDVLICQYCDREFVSSEKLIKHELQHLIGNQFEMALKMLKDDKPAMEGKIEESKDENEKIVNAPNDNSKKDASQNNVKQKSVSEDMQNVKTKEESISNGQKVEVDEKYNENQKVEDKEEIEFDDGTSKTSAELSPDDKYEDLKDKTEEMGMSEENNGDIEMREDGDIETETKTLKGTSSRECEISNIDGIKSSEMSKSKPVSAVKLKENILSDADNNMRNANAKGGVIENEEEIEERELGKNENEEKKVEKEKESSSELLDEKMEDGFKEDKICGDASSDDIVSENPNEGKGRDGLETGEVSLDDKEFEELLKDDDNKMNDGVDNDVHEN